MKKYIFLFVILLIITLTICSCGDELDNPLENSNYSVKIASFSDSISESNLEVEFDKWNKDSFLSYTAEKSVNLSLYDATIEASYKDSKIEEYDFYVTHRYLNQDGTRVSVTEEGKLSGCFFGKGSDDSQGNKIYTEQECINIACEFIDKITSSCDYTIKSEYDSYLGAYEIVFEKYDNEVRFADSACVVVLETGQIYSYNSTMIGQMSTNITVDFDMTQVEDDIKNRLDFEYENAKEYYDDITYNTIGYVLTLDEDGNQLLICTVDVDCKEYLNEHIMVSSERIRFVVQKNI